MTRLKSCPGCAYPRPADLRVPCPRCGSQTRNGSTRDWRRRRGPIMQRDGLRCGECSRPLTGGLDTHIDHIVAKSNGGTDDASNLRVLCETCNKRKGAL